MKIYCLLIECCTKGQNIANLKSKTDKRPVKQLRTDVQTKWCFFMVKVIVHQFITCITPVCTKTKKKMRALQRYKYFWLVTKPPQTFTNGDARFSANIGNLKISMNFWMYAECSGLIYVEWQIFIEELALQNGYLFICLWCLLVPLCTVSYGISRYGDYKTTKFLNTTIFFYSLTKN